MYQYAEYKISQWKNELLLPESIKEESLQHDKDVFTLEIYKKYQLNLQAMNAVDFDDLILLVVHLWRKFPQTLEKCQQRYHYIMVDEFQDTNVAQFEMINLLGGEQKNICAVGDDDQSIYSWRGADIHNILNFGDNFNTDNIIYLEQNYRSTNTILQAANSLIANNSVRKEKNLWSQLGQGYSLDCIYVKDEIHEAEFVANKILTMNKKFNISKSDFSILYRSNAQSRAFEMAFREFKIPYVVIGGQNFYDRKEVKDIIAYLNIMHNPADDISLLRIINCPKRGIGENTLIKLIEISHKKNIPVLELVHDYFHELPIPMTNKKHLRTFEHQINQLKQKLTGHYSLSKFVEELIHEINYRHELKLQYKSEEQIEARWENIEELINSIAREEAEKGFFSVHDFIDSISLDSDFGDTDKENKGQVVKLMTLHSSKGMEFPYVFMVGMEDGLFPHKKSLEDPALEEERRLCYVGITRAKSHLMFLCCRHRFKAGKPIPSSPSRFLREIPPQLINQKMYHEAV